MQEQDKEPTIFNEWYGEIAIIARGRVGGQTFVVGASRSLVQAARFHVPQALLRRASDVFAQGAAVNWEGFSDQGHTDDAKRPILEKHYSTFAGDVEELAS